MRRVAPLMMNRCLLFLIPLVCVGGVGDVDFAQGLKLHTSGQYVEARSAFQLSVSGAGAGSPASHYYLADCLFRLGQRRGSMFEYERALALDPNGAYGAYARQILDKYGVQPAAHKVKAASGESLGQQQLERQARERLPKLPAPESQTPGTAEVMAWGLQEKIDYIEQAKERVSRANQKLNEAGQLKEKAAGVINQLLGSLRKYGESETEFQARVLNSKDRLGQLLQPYDAHCERCHKELDQQQSILTTCQQALFDTRGYTR